MKNLINGLLKDERLDGLMVTHEFFVARDRLQIMRWMLNEGEKLSKEQKQYVKYVAKHIKNIRPHIEYMTVDGEEHIPVHFWTDLSGTA